MLSSVAAEIDFIVLPPLWRRWWFESLALALAIVLVFAAHRYRVAQMVNLERIRTAIATDLHDDIGASLSQEVMSPEVAIRVVELFRRTQTPGQSFAGFSPQEMRLLKPLTEGQNKTAAAELGSAFTRSAFTCARFTRSCTCIRGRRRLRARSAKG